MARFGCLALSVVVAMALLIFIVFLWSGWLNRPVGHAPSGLGPASVSIAPDPPAGAAVTVATIDAR